MKSLFKNIAYAVLGEGGVNALMTSYWRRRNQNPENYEREIRLLPRWVKAGDLVVDVGANMGQYSTALSRLVGPTGLVVAFEASPSTAALTRRILAGTGVELHACALSDHAGTVELELFADAAGNLIRGHTRVKGDDTGRTPARRETAQVRTLDEVIKDRKSAVRFMKIDVEGHELSVLAGARQVLSQDRPMLLIEANGEANFLRLEELLKPLGYACWINLPDGQIKAATGYDPKVCNYLYSVTPLA